MTITTLRQQTRRACTANYWELRAHVCVSHAQSQSLSPSQSQSHLLLGNLLGACCLSLLFLLLLLLRTNCYLTICICMCVSVCVYVCLHTVTGFALSVNFGWFYWPASTFLSAGTASAAVALPHPLPICVEPIKRLLKANLSQLAFGWA